MFYNNVVKSPATKKLVLLVQIVEQKINYDQPGTGSWAQRIRRLACPKYPKCPKPKIIEVFRKSRPNIGGTKAKNKKTNPACSGHQVVQNVQNH